MEHDILTSLSRLPDAELVAQVKALVAREHDVTSELIARLAELDTRDVHLREGYSSLYVYCRDVLGLSEWEAYDRIEVARAARRFPVILELLARGSVNLTTVRLLAPHLTPGNHREVLDSSRGKRKAEVQEIVARLAPRRDARSFVRRLPSNPSVSLQSRPSESFPSLPTESFPSVPTESFPTLPTEALPTLPTEALPTDRSVAHPMNKEEGQPAAVLRSDPRSSSTAGPDPAVVPIGSAISAPEPPAPVTRPRVAGSVTPLSPDRYRLQLTITRETLEKLRLAKDMLGHASASGDDAAVIDRALTTLLVNLAKKKFAATRKPRPSQSSRPGARYPAAAVKRAVWLRDGGRCAFVGTNGNHCGERRFLEFHHVDPYALGGEATVDGTALRCRRHNDYEGRLYFGKRRPRERTCSGTSSLESGTLNPMASA